MPTSSPQATCGSWDLFQPCKILYKPKIHKGCTLPCSLWITKWMYPPLELIHKRCTLSCSQYNNPQVDVPSTCTTKDVPSNVLGQRILRRLVLWIFVSRNKIFLRRLVLWNLLFKGKRRIKRILRLCLFEFFEKGEGRHKRIQAVSPLFFWKKEKRDTKRIQVASPCRILFSKGRREWKDIAQFCFLWKNKVWKPENSESFWHRKKKKDK